MQCNVCSKETADLVAMRSEGETLMVCSSCRQSSVPLKKMEAIVSKVQKPEQLDLTGKGMLKENYNQIIQQARQKQNLTFEQLSKKLFEKESTLKKVESGAIKPEDKLIEKLEKNLNISLKEAE